MQDIGYNNHNSIRLLGSLCFLNLLYFTRVLIWLPLIKTLSLLVPKFQAYSNKLLNEVIFEEIILLSFEAYLEYLISGYINYQFSFNTYNGEKAGIFVSYYVYIVSLVIFPLLMIYALTR